MLGTPFPPFPGFCTAASCACASAGDWAPPPAPASARGRFVARCCCRFCLAAAARLDAAQVLNCAGICPKGAAGAQSITVWGASKLPKAIGAACSCYHASCCCHMVDSSLAALWLLRMACTPDSCGCDNCICPDCIGRPAAVAAWPPGTGPAAVQRCCRSCTAREVWRATWCAWSALHSLSKSSKCLATLSRRVSSHFNISPACKTNPRCLGILAI